MLVVGLTGGIGSGKSTVAGLLAERGAHVIDVDGLGREVIAPGGRAEAQVIEAFGEGIRGADGHIARPKLAAVVFGDASALDRLTAISHPAINAELADRLAQRPDDVVVLDMAILVESILGMGMYDKVVVVEAPPALRIERAVDRGMARADAEARLAAQATDEQRRAVANYVVTNAGTLDELRRAVAELWAQIELWRSAAGQRPAAT